MFNGRLHPLNPFPSPAILVVAVTRAETPPSLGDDRGNDLKLGPAGLTHSGDLFPPSFVHARARAEAPISFSNNRGLDFELGPAVFTRAGDLWSPGTFRTGLGAKLPPVLDT